MELKTTSSAPIANADKAKIETPYDRIALPVGEEVAEFRPIEWDREMVDGEGHAADGSMAKPTLFEGTCWHCGQLMIIKAGLSSARCPECEVGVDVALPVFVSPFVDPVAYEFKADTPDAPDCDTPDCDCDYELPPGVPGDDDFNFDDDVLKAIEEAPEP